MAYLNLHKLANSGGFGAAKKTLQEHGAWDELANDPRKSVCTYEVKLTRYAAIKTTLVVKATDEVMAEKKATAVAEGAIRDDVLWAGEWDHDDFPLDEFEAVEVVEVVKVNEVDS